MAYSGEILFGHLTKTNGFDGAVTVRLENIFIENIPKLESVFLEVEGRLVPFFIAYLKYAGAGTIKLKFDGYDSVEKITEFAGVRVFLTKSKSDIIQPDDKELKGYEVLIEDDKLLGTITEIIPNPGQLLLNILSVHNKNVLIPLHEHFIVSINKARKIIVLDIPDGLLEINT
jgi:16S rRNA processing protein RimM